MAEISRFRDVPRVTTPDGRGRVVRAMEARPLPDVRGDFRHVVHAGDRLDHLAGMHYGRPRHWWHICDANPEFLSPLALVSADAVMVTSFPVAVIRDDGAPDVDAASGPPWARLLSALRALHGVAGVQVFDDVEVVAGPPVGRDRIVVHTQRPVRSVRVTHNRVTAPADLIAAVLRAVPVDVGPHDEVGQVGREIVIPPPVAG
jgi:hypothetical protein